MKGEFENRLRQVIDEVQASPKPIILFIDEAHTLIGAGGAAGTGDAANLLKPALARGKLRTIAATTWAEYKKYFEKDPALTRRFQVVQVERAERGEGAADDARPGLDAREAPPRAAPRRGARGGGQALAPLHPGAPAAGQGGQPARHRLRARRRSASTPCRRDVEDSRRRIEALQTELEIIGREQRGRHRDRRRARRTRAASSRRSRSGSLQLEARWKTEKALVDRVLAIRADLRKDGDAGAEATSERDERAAARLKGLLGRARDRCRARRR